MRDYYRFIKNFIPEKFRLLLKPVYLKWSLRSFRKPETVKIKHYNFLIEVNPANVYVDEYIFIHRSWETIIGDVIERELKEGNTFVDAGANIGYFTLLASTLVGKNGRVVAYEPIPRIARQIHRSVDANGFNNVEIRELALGNENKQMEISIMPDNIGASSIIKRINSGVVEKILVKRLDDEISENENVDFIKIDVEGYELEMLQGAERILKTRSPALVIEFSPEVYAQREDNVARSILEFLQDLGYQSYDLENKITISDIDTYLGILGNRQTNIFASLASQ